MCKQTGTVIIFRCFVPINGAAFPANGQMNPDTVFFDGSEQEKMKKCLIFKAVYGIIKLNNYLLNYRQSKNR